MNKTVDVGPVTAYAAAKSAGYTGTYEQFCYDQAHFAENAQAVAEDMATTEGYKNEALQAKQDAETAVDGAKYQKQLAQVAASDSAGYRDDAHSYSTRAQNSAQEIEDLTVDSATLPPGSEAYVTKSKMTGQPYHLQFGIPKGEKGDKGNILFASFYVDDNGQLQAVYDDDYTGPTFAITNNGILEVSIR